jgi:LysM domain
MKYIVTLLFSLVCCRCLAENDSLFIVKKGSFFAIKHIIKSRETLKMLAQRYYTTENDIEAINEFTSKNKYAPGEPAYIPLTSKNFFSHKQPLDITDITNVYYRVREKDNMNAIISYFPVRNSEKPMTKDELRNMNGLKGYNIEPDQVLFMGWVKMIQPDSLNYYLGNGYPKPIKKKAEKPDGEKQNFSGLDIAYNAATQNGANVLTENGTAVFFEKPGKNDLYYGFHNTTPRNTVIKVVNPGNNKMIYVKIIGPVPETKQFAGCIIAISNTAKEELGVTEGRAWLELSYPAN